MTTLGEVAGNMKIYTEERFLCPNCNKNNNFLYFATKENDKYYLLEMCPKCLKHIEDIREIPSRMAKDYPTLQK